MLSDIDFLKINNLSEFIEYDTPDNDLYFIKGEISLGSYGRMFGRVTSKPEEKLFDILIEKKITIECELREHLENQMQLYNEAEAGIRDTFTREPEHHDIKIEELEDEIKSISEMGSWISQYTKQSCFEYEVPNWEHALVYTTKVSELKKIYLDLEKRKTKDYEAREPILSAEELVTIFGQMALDKTYHAFEVVGEPILNTFEEWKSKEEEIKQLFDTYQSIPMGTLFYQQDQNIHYISRKTSSELLRGYSEDITLKPQFSMESPSSTIVGPENDTDNIRQWIYMECPLTNSIQLVDETFVANLLDSLDSGRGIHTCSDKVNGKSRQESFEEGKQRLYKTLDIKL